jgi:hypothetical protein
MIFGLLLTKHGTHLRGSHCLCSCCITSSCDVDLNSVIRARENSIKVLPDANETLHGTNSHPHLSITTFLRDTNWRTMVISGRQHVKKFELNQFEEINHQKDKRRHVWCLVLLRSKGR